MQLKSFANNLFTVLLYYKIFSLPLCVTLVVLLIRIPLGTFSEASLLDPIAHVILPASTAALLFALLVRNHFFVSTTKGGALLLILLLGVMVEVVWEITEYIIDLTLRLGWQLGNADTMNDLILAVVGSTIAGLLFLKFYRSTVS